MEIVDSITQIIIVFVKSIRIWKEHRVIQVIDILEINNPAVGGRANQRWISLKTLNFF